MSEIYAVDAESVELSGARRRTTDIRTLLAAAPLSFGILALCAVVAMIGPLITPHDPDAFVGAPFSSPSWEHSFGTDDLGRDELSRSISAMRVAMIVGVCSVLIGTVLGTAIGVIAGSKPGKLDTVLMRVMDVKFAFPELVLALVILAALGSGVTTTILAIGIVFIPRHARIARTATRTVESSPFIESARVSGVREPTIMVRHVVPNIATPVVVLTALNFANAQLAYAALAFLGFGARPPQADFGTMLSVARSYMTFAEWLVIFPGACLVLLTVSSNLVGDAVYEHMGSQSSGRVGRSKPDRARAALPRTEPE